VAQGVDFDFKHQYHKKKKLKKNIGQSRDRPSGRKAFWFCTCARVTASSPANHMNAKGKLNFVKFSKKPKFLARKSPRN
jgi:hypothetical protein